MTFKSSLKKWVFGILALIIILTTVVSCGMLSEINFYLGKHTDVVDSSQFNVTSGNLAIKNVNVLSSSFDSILKNKIVLIRDNKIEAIEDSINIPEDYYNIDGTNKYLIPGLIDSHVHIKKSPNDLLLYLANGITQVGEMTGMKEHFQYQKEIESGKRLGPDIYIASPKVSSEKGIKVKFRSWFERRQQNYTTEKAARRAVRKYKSQGYKAIKLASQLFDRDIYFAITDEAKKQNIPVIGHLPAYVYMEDLYTSGQSQLSHLASITLSEMNEYGGVDYTNAEAFLSYFKKKVDSIAIKLKENNITISTTLWVYETKPKQDFDLANFLKTIPLEYQNPGWLEPSKFSGGWLPGTGNGYENPNNTDAKSKSQSEIFWNMQTEALHILTKALIRHGVVITAGTDANGANGVVAGFSLHSELESLANVGVSNSKVLESATLATAKWMNINTGEIKVGYDADLVILNKNPLDDIKNTTTINAVIVNGKYLNRTTLDKMLLDVKEANNRSRKMSIDEYLD